MRTVDRAEIAVLVGPFVPDADAVFLEIGDIGIAAQEPDQLVDDRLQMQLLRRHQREAVGEIEAHLVAEDRFRAGAGPVGFDQAGVEHELHQIEILAHLLSLANSASSGPLAQGKRRNTDGSRLFTARTTAYIGIAGFGRLWR